MKIKKENGYCAPYVIKYLSGLSDNKVMALCKAAGFTPEWGMEDYEVLRVLRKIGVAYTRLELKKMGLYRSKLKDFCKRKSSGDYLIYTSVHIFCVSNGTVIDPINDGFIGEERLVTGVWKLKKKIKKEKKICTPLITPPQEII